MGKCPSTGLHFHAWAVFLPLPSRTQRLSSVACPVPLRLRPQISMGHAIKQGYLLKIHISMKTTLNESLRRIIHSYLELSGDIQRPFVIIMSMFLWVELTEILKGTK